MIILSRQCGWPWRSLRNGERRNLNEEENETEHTVIDLLQQDRDFSSCVFEIEKKGGRYEYHRGSRPELGHRPEK